MSPNSYVKYKKIIFIIIDTDSNDINQTFVYVFTTRIYMFKYYSTNTHILYLYIQFNLDYIIIWRMSRSRYENILHFQTYQTWEVFENKNKNKKK